MQFWKDAAEFYDIFKFLIPQNHEKMENTKSSESFDELLSEFQKKIHISFQLLGQRVSSWLSFHAFQSQQTNKS